ncbi:MAG TPA: hypothetical protein VK661_08795, partial [Planctomycetota bacterium]|nr:hypothetical protein [Planctomycetota bacterium]
MTEESAYLSDRDRSIYQRNVALAAVAAFIAAFIAQFVLPFAAMFLIIPFPWSRDATTHSYLECGATWEGRIYWPKSGSDGTTTLLRFDPAKEGDPEIAAEVPFSRCWLLAAQDCLWIISPMGTARLTSGGMEKIDTERLGVISRPFLWNGSPAVVVRDQDELRLRRLLKGSWTLESVPGVVPEFPMRTPPVEFQAVA